MYPTVCGSYNAIRKKRREKGIGSSQIYALINASPEDLVCTRRNLEA